MKLNFQHQLPGIIQFICRINALPIQSATVASCSDDLERASFLRFDGFMYDWEVIDPAHYAPIRRRSPEYVGSFECISGVMSL